LDANEFWKRVLLALPGLRNRGRRWTRNAADADDLTQDALVRALEHRQQVRDPDRLPGWLAATQRTVHLNSRRSAAARLEVLPSGDAPVEPAGDLAAEIEQRGFSDETSKALSSLPEEWREALLLREVEELSYEEIARVQECPVGTVRSRLARARAAMAAALGKESHERVQ
jgi:RNA polymerase sigma-70 factor (ECF subfamily)